MRVFLILLGGVMLAGVVMALLVSAVGERATWLVMPVLASSVGLVWRYASRSSPAR